MSISSYSFWFMRHHDSLPDPTYPDRNLANPPVQSLLDGVCFLPSETPQGSGCSSMWDDNSVGDPQVSSKPALFSFFSSLSLVCICLFPPLHCFLSGNSQPPKTVLLWTLLPLPSSSLQTCASVHCFRWQLWADSSILPPLLGFRPHPHFHFFPSLTSHTFPLHSPTRHFFWYF